MYNSRIKNIDLPENLFSNLGELKSGISEQKLNNTFSTKPSIRQNYSIKKDINVINYPIKNDIKLTNYSNKKEYRDRMDKMHEDMNGIIPIDNEIDNILYFNNYVEKGIVVKPQISSLKQFWTEYRLINNEKNKETEKQLLSKNDSKELDDFDELFAALSERITEINSYIDELKQMRTNIDKNTKKLEEDKEKLANERSQFNTYKQKEETKLKKEKENLKINFDRLQTIIDDLDKKLVSIEN